MKFKKAIITAGSTIEWIDPVRYISNASTGKMGFCIASEFSKFLSTNYIKANVNPKYDFIKNTKIFSTNTNYEMENTVLSLLEENTILIMAAAPLDFKSKNVINEKIKKSKFSKISLVPNKDILIEVKKKNKLKISKIQP